jgi:glycosyltransferase involved in cell wall biosynthesis
MPDFLVLTAIVPKILGAKLILDIHDPMPEFYMSKFSKRNRGFGVLLIRMQEKLSSLVAHGVITANSNFKRNLVKRGIPSNKITVIRNIPDSRIFNRGAYAKKDNRGDDCFTLIYHGTIAPRYGLYVAIRSLPLLIPKIPQLRFVIIGQPVEHVGELVRLAKQLDVSSSVQFKPPVPIEEVPMEIMQADVGIYPAISDPHMSVAIPSKVLEYAVMGIPIIASRLKVLEDLFTDSAILFFEPGAESEFANRVLELYNNKKRRDELVRNADSIFTLKSSWKSESTKYFKVLNYLLSSAR